jgi:hypothetical protein
VPICTPQAPSASAAAMPRASVTAPAAITGTFIGRKPLAPSCLARIVEHGL